MTIQDITSKRPIGLISIDVKTISDRLRKCEIGEIVKYSELEELIGRSVREQGSWILLSARRRLLNQDQILFGVVTKVGVQRLSDSQVVRSSQSDVSRIHRASRRGLSKLAAVRDYNALSKDDKILHGVNVSALGILAHITKERQIKKLQAAVEKTQTALPLQKTLDAFSDGV